MNTNLTCIVAPCAFWLRIYFLSGLWLPSSYASRYAIYRKKLTRWNVDHSTKPPKT